jgi:hypothetical protein
MRTAPYFHTVRYQLSLSLSHTHTHTYIYIHIYTSLLDLKTNLSTRRVTRIHTHSALPTATHTHSITTHTHTLTHTHTHTHTSILDLKTNLSTWRVTRILGRFSCIRLRLAFATKDSRCLCSVDRTSWHLHNHMHTHGMCVGEHLHKHIWYVKSVNTHQPPLFTLSVTHIITHTPETRSPLHHLQALAKICALFLSRGLDQWCW